MEKTNTLYNFESFFFKKNHDTTQHPIKQHITTPATLTIL